MKSVHKRNILVFISVLLGLAAIWYIIDSITLQQVLDTFKYATWELIIIYVIIQLSLFLVLTYRWKLILHSQNHKDIGLWKLLGYKLVGYGVSFLTPSAKVGGEPVRAGLLASKEKMSFQRALSSVVIDKTVELSTNGLFTVVGFIVILFSFVVSTSMKTTLISVIVIFLLLIIVFNYQMIRGKKFFSIILQWFGHKKEKPSKFFKKVLEFEDLVVKFYKDDTKYFFYTLFWSIISWVIMFIEFKVAAALIGLDLTVFQIFLVVCMVGAATIVPIPMGLGALEAGQVGVFALLSIKAAAGVALAFIVRLKDIILAVIGMLLLAFYGLNLKEVVKDTGYITKEVKKLKKQDEK